MPETQMRRSSAAEFLGVPVEAGREEVVAAYRRYVRAHHPDAGEHRGKPTDAGADLEQAARARACLLGSQRPGTGSAHDAFAGRQRTFHKSSPWWRRMILWRNP